MASAARGWPCGLSRVAAQGAILATFAALSDHLRHLEDFSRNSEERTHRTFEALHETLVQIATRLDEIFHGIQAIKLNRMEDYQTGRFRAIVDRIRAGNHWQVRGGRIPFADVPRSRTEGAEDDD